MRHILWITILFMVSICAVWLVLSSWVPKNTVELSLVMIFFIGAPVGNFWMLYRTIRYEKKPWPFVIIALVVPLAFLWYYVERVRPQKAGPSPSHA
jgi:hypothetical protein